MQNQGLEFGLGALQWELVGTLLLAWIVVYLIIWKGLHSSGKVLACVPNQIIDL
jgi:hypothetical protein